MAALITSLFVSGSRKSDGAVNAAGKVYCYTPGTNTQATIFSTQAGDVPLPQPVTLDNAGRAEIYRKGPIRLYIEDSVGAVVRDGARGASVRAEEVEVENVGFNGINAAGSTVAGQRTHLDTVLTNLYTSTGGLDAQYLESTGATARALKARLGEHIISVKDWGAKGDNSANDTAAIQAAINRADTVGGGVVFFPVGIYRIDAALTISLTNNATRLVGASPRDSIIRNTSGTANAITVTGQTGTTSYDRGGGISTLMIDNTGTSTGACIDLLNTKGFVVEDCFLDAHDIGVDVRQTINNRSRHNDIRHCHIEANNAAAGRCVRIGSGSADADGLSTTRVIDCYFIDGTTAGSASIEILSVSRDTVIRGCYFDNPVTGLLVNANHSANGISMSGCHMAAYQTNKIVLNSTSTAGFREWDNFFPDTAGITVVAGQRDTYWGSGRHLNRKGADVAAAESMTVGYGGNHFSITAGTATVQYMATTGWPNGSQVTLQTTGGLTIEHAFGAAPANFAAFRFPGNVDAVMTDKDTATVVFDGTDWICLALVTTR